LQSLRLNLHSILYVHRLDVLGQPISAERPRSSTPHKRCSGSSSSPMLTTFPSSWFCGVVGYHFCLTHRRSPVRTRAESSLLLSWLLFCMSGKRVGRICGVAKFSENLLEFDGENIHCRSLHDWVARPFGIQDLPQRLVEGVRRRGIISLGPELLDDSSSSSLYWSSKLSRIGFPQL
ncbi:hypothetical protein KCU86_g83, partial [Aureobasidium melanogenum]